MTGRTSWTCAGPPSPPRRAWRPSRGNGRYGDDERALARLPCRNSRDGLLLRGLGYDLVGGGPDLGRRVPAVPALHGLGAGMLAGHMLDARNLDVPGAALGLVVGFREVPDG